jgi:hypothetical protein
MLVWYQHKYRHKEQQNNIEDPEINRHGYSYLIPNKRAKNISWRKKQPLQQIVLEYPHVEI